MRTDLRLPPPLLLVLWVALTAGPAAAQVRLGPSVFGHSATPTGNASVIVLSTVGQFAATPTPRLDSGFWPTQRSLLVGTASEPPPMIPGDYYLAGNYPNPFNAGSATTVTFGLPEAARATVTVYDLLGRRVCVLADGERAAGQHEVRWNGRDGAGQTAASGVYLYQLRASDRTFTRRMLLVH